MTDRHTGLTVTFSEPMREDEAKYIIDAIRMIRGVIEVRPYVADGEHYMAYARARHDIQEKLWEALRDA